MFIRKLSFILILILIPVSTVNSEELSNNYDTGINVIKVLISNKDFAGAEDVLKTMLKQYPDNTELLSILASVLFWQKKYDESIDTYRKILQLKDDDSLRMKMEKVFLAKIIHETDLMIKEGKTSDAEVILRFLFDSGIEEYESGYKLGMLYIKERDYKKAIDVFKRLKETFPEDRGFTALYIESLILNGNLKEAKKDLYSLPEEIRDYIYREREDLFYRVRREYIKVSGCFFNYTRGYKDELNQSLEISLRVKDLTSVLNVSHIYRYGLHDSQIALDIYSKIGEMTKRWGYLSFSISNGKFLPKTAFGGEIYQGYKKYEFSFGYRRMNFRDTSVDILIPGVIVYLPYGLSLNERIYIVPKNGSYTLLSTLYYEPNHKLRVFYSIAVGKSAEKMGSLEDIQKLSTFSNRLGIEYKFMPQFSAGAEISQEYRKNLYSKYGFTIFTRYWW